MTSDTRYAVFLGDGDQWEVWACTSDHIKLLLISRHEYSEDAHKARRDAARRLAPGDRVFNRLDQAATVLERTPDMPAEATRVRYDDDDINVWDTPTDRLRLIKEDDR